MEWDCFLYYSGLHSTFSLGISKAVKLRCNDYDTIINQCIKSQSDIQLNLCLTGAFPSEACHVTVISAVDKIKRKKVENWIKIAGNLGVIKRFYHS